MSAISIPEQRAARKALERLEVHLSQRKIKPKISLFPPIFLHGLPGTGKSELFRQLLEHITALDPSLVCQILPARELAELLRQEAEAEAVQIQLRDVDLLIVEDLQYFSNSASEALCNILDDLQQNKGYFLASATSGPMILKDLSARLKSRLSGGLVLRMGTLTESSRRKLTAQLLKAKKLHVSEEVLDFLARQPGECRETVGRVVQLETLARMVPVPLRLSDVSTYFSQTSQPVESSIDRVSRLVAKNMGTDIRKMRSQARHAGVTWARQVAMYLARQVTDESLVAIGRYFGGRDHSTVLHALTKVSERMKDDPTIRREIERWVQEAK
ncbi:hypothetical protein KIH39_20510 [Telmatocola sphagniphila]|uniref:Chromosomal replication initiator DnaA C-terminal domain-containing protein n=1 Tax=Telmatocola sphagniphila TaxID=1123043 RepID=A0A8E6EUG2_9BACT|nr:helix-turn-helix domain-containing protein [Telmatocola sphagniphila]QVL31207.1 hypothetical protein KIH39_20510 [Telmatocola sphagniphila]